MSQGWIKLHRQILEHPRHSDPYWLSVWIHLLLNATHKPIKALHGGKIIELKPGQLVTGRARFSRESGVSEQVIRRVFNQLQDDGQINQETTNTSSLITILNWEEYQEINQPTTNNQPTNNQQSTTVQEVHIYKEEVQLELVQEEGSAEGRNPKRDFRSDAKTILAYLNEKTSKSFREIDTHLDPIACRLKEHAVTVDGVLKMIDRQVALWKCDEVMCKHLTPETLFRKSNFAKYYDLRDEPIKNTISNSPQAQPERKTLNDPSIYAGIIGKDENGIIYADSEVAPTLPGIQ